MSKPSRLGARLLNCADVEIRSAVRSQSPIMICDRIICAQILLKLALREYEKELSDVDTHPPTKT